MVEEVVVDGGGGDGWWWMVDVVYHVSMMDEEVVEVVAGSGYHLHAITLPLDEFVQVATPVQRCRIRDTRPKKIWILCSGAA